MHDPTVFSLFSGIGGLDYGLARAGWRHVGFCESDEWRRSVLAHHWPGVPVYDDVRAVGVEPAARAPHDGRGPGGDGTRRLHASAVPDLLVGGFPCQDLSVAGQRRGLAGERSGLFFEFARIIDAFRPGWVLIENVPGLLSSNGGRDFGVVLGTLADIGYGLAWRVVDSRFFGVPQRRRRVFIVGALADTDSRAAAERAGDVLAVGSRCPRHPATRGEARERDAAASVPGAVSAGERAVDAGRADRELAGTLGGGSGDLGWAQDTERMTFVPALTSKMQKGTSGPAGDEHHRLIAARQLTSGGGKAGQGYPMVRQKAFVRRLTPVECERLQGLPDNWTNPTGDAPDSRRYAALGDAVTAPVAEWIGRRLIAADYDEQWPDTPESDEYVERMEGIRQR